jgi:hypothetical protein
MGRRVAIISSAVGALLAAVAAAVAEVPEVRFARQFSISYLQFNLMERQRLVEKHAKAAGIPGVEVGVGHLQQPGDHERCLVVGICRHRVGYCRLQVAAHHPQYAQSQHPGYRGFQPTAIRAMRLAGETSSFPRSTRFSFAEIHALPGG